MIEFDIEPTPKPRMTKSDAWRQRPRVMRYWAYKDQLTLLTQAANYVVPAVIDGLTFVLPMPKSWSKKKKAEMNNTPHQNKPDLDNLLKGFKDCLCENDSYVHTYNNVRKVWGETGKIIIAEWR